MSTRVTVITIKGQIERERKRERAREGERERERARVHARERERERESERASERDRGEGGGWFRPQHAGQKPSGTRGAIPLSSHFDAGDPK